MTSQQIITFLEIASCLNYREASEKLYITQPAATKQIHTLEKELGFLLFIRNKRNVALTPAGEVFLQFARRIKSDFDSTIRVCSQLQLSNTIEIVCEISIRSQITNEAMARFIRKYPNIGIRFEYCDTSDIVNAIINKSYDIFICHIDRLVNDVPDLNVTKLEQKHFGFLAKKGYMGVTEQPDSPSVYNGCEFFDPIARDLTAEGRSKYSRLPIEARIEKVHELGLIPGKFSSKNNWQSVIATVEMGLGVTLVDEDIWLEKPDNFFWVKNSKKSDVNALWYLYNSKPELKHFLEILEEVKEEML